MLVDPSKCIGCGKCSIFCPMDCIILKPRPSDLPGKGKRYVVVDEDECVECRCCLRAGVCEQDALFQPPLQWLRTIRAAFSDPSSTFEETGVPGRGTEEIKTNEVTGRFKRGRVGIATEMGRPGLGARLRDLEKMAMGLAQIGTRFEPMNPVSAALMEDTETGKLKICLPEPDGTIPVLPIVKEEGFNVRINGKTNLGLGRRTNKEQQR
jgi:NAD-dependent dihydropyrimidine dehydrogenase PreA subunit